MPENSQVKPSDVEMVRSLTKKTSDLAFLTVDLVNEGNTDDAKVTAACCSEGLNILREYFRAIQPADAAAIAGEVRRRNQAAAERLAQ